jgi:hypothetical protein
MGAREDVPPWQRGGTFANGDPTISDPTNIALYGPGGENLCGRTYVFEAAADATQLQYSTLGPDPTGRQVTVKVARNNSSISLLPGRLCHWDGTVANYETYVDGYTYQPADRPAGVVDDFIGPNGVAPNDLFYLVIDGPTKICQLDAVQPAWNEGDRLVPADSSATSTSRTNNAGGRVGKQDLTGATAALGNQIQNQVGFANSTVAGGSVATVGTVLIPVVVHLGNNVD